MAQPAKLFGRFVLGRMRNLSNFLSDVDPTSTVA